MLVNPVYNVLAGVQTSPLLHFSEGNKGNKRCLRLEAIRELPWHSYAVEALYLGSFSNNDDQENVNKAIALITKTTTLHVHYTFWYICR